MIASICLTLKKTHNPQQVICTPAPIIAHQYRRQSKNRYYGQKSNEMN